MKTNNRVPRAIVLQVQRPHAPPVLPGGQKQSATYRPARPVQRKLTRPRAMFKDPQLEGQIASFDDAPNVASLLLRPDSNLVRQTIERDRLAMVRLLMRMADGEAEVDERIIEILTSDADFAPASQFVWLKRIFGVENDENSDDDQEEQEWLARLAHIAEQDNDLAVAQLGKRDWKRIEAICHEFAQFYQLLVLPAFL